MHKTEKEISIVNVVIPAQAGYIHKVQVDGLNFSAKDIRSATGGWL